MGTDWGIIGDMIVENKTKDMIGKRSLAGLPFGRRESIITALAELPHIVDIPIIVEIGTTRWNTKDSIVGDGWASIPFAYYAIQAYGLFATIDIDNDAIINCRSLIEEHVPVLDNRVKTQTFYDNVKYFNMNSIDFFDKYRTISRNFEVRNDGSDYRPKMDINMLYMDGAYDEEQNLLEIQHALPHMSNACLVLIDDTLFTFADDEPSIIGKGALVIPYLLENDFDIINIVDYGQNSQVLLRRYS